MSEKLSFFLNIPTPPGITIDYTELGLRLLNLAKKTLKGETKTAVINVIDQAFNAFLQNKAPCSPQTRKTIHAALFEIAMMEIPPLDQHAESARRATILRHAIEAGLPESNNLLAESCGLPFGESLTSNVSNEDSRTDLIIELAAQLKKANEELAQWRTLSSEKANAQDKPSSPSPLSHFFTNAMELPRTPKEDAKSSQYYTFK